MPNYNEVNEPYEDDDEVETTNRYILKSDLLGHWIESDWIPRFPGQDWITLWDSMTCVNEKVLAQFDKALKLHGDFNFAGYEPYPCSAVARVNTYTDHGELTARTGAYCYKFTSPTETIEVLIVGTFTLDQPHSILAFACVPKNFIQTWTAFSNECLRLSQALIPTSEVYIIGGRFESFAPTVDWDDIVIPDELKAELLDDVRSFFTKGVDIYKRLKLKPFRKLLLAGVPGTGKTMLCAALAKWAIAQGYLVIYISSADHNGAAFWKVDQALTVASKSCQPTLIFLEEVDAYAKIREKALVLNVLDGADSAINDFGTMLISTTNYPEAIDERVLKRPGRLDRIFIIPEIKDRSDAEKMLRKYLGEMWKDEHRGIAQELVGYPGAFIREVAIFALTQVAYEDLDHLPLEVLERSYNRLREQIDARDDFLTRRGDFGFAFEKQ